MLQLGDDIARSLGLNVEKHRLVFISLAALLAASAVSVAGLLGFVELPVGIIMAVLAAPFFLYLLRSNFNKG
ncbi:hypothetical protein JCM12294_32960 [Desulfocicer niacini]